MSNFPKMGTPSAKPEVNTTFAGTTRPKTGNAKGGSAFPEPDKSNRRNVLNNPRETAGPSGRIKGTMRGGVNDSSAASLTRNVRRVKSVFSAPDNFNCGQGDF